MGKNKNKIRRLKKANRNKIKRDTKNQKMNVGNRIGKRKTKIWFFSDTSGNHDELKVPEVDIACFIGDAGSDTKSGYVNQDELVKFLEWFAGLNIIEKIFVPGERDIALYNNLIHEAQFPEIEFLCNTNYMSEELRIFGSPITKTLAVPSPPYAQSALGRTLVWDTMYKTTDIILTHMPPYGIMDSSKSGTVLTSTVMNTGDKLLKEKVLEIEPKIHAFGHVRDDNDIINAGSYKNPESNTIFINATCSDVKGNHVHNGVIMEV